MADLLKGHIAVITGGASGIGRAIALGYAREGAQIVVLDANAQGAAETCKAATAAGGQGDFVQARRHRPRRLPQDRG